MKLSIAMQVAVGYRRHLPDFIPLPLRELITECWAPHQRARPPITEVVDRLTGFQKGLTGGTTSNNIDHDSHNAPKKGCCIVM
jgi:hypothetical protein